MARDLYHLYEVENPYNKATQAMGGAANSLASMSKDTKQTSEQDAGGKDASGALLSAGGGAMAGASVMGGGALYTAGVGLTSTGYGAVIGAGLMLAAYLFS